MSCTCCTSLSSIQGQTGDSITSLTEIEIWPTFWQQIWRSISSHDMNQGCELTSDSETRDQYKISLGPDFRYQSRIKYHVTFGCLTLAKKAVTMNLMVKRTISLYVIWIELDETYATI